jgi:hypothetical protein
VLKPQSAQLGFKRSFFQFAAKRTLMIVNEGSESPCLRVCSGVCYLSFNGFLLYTVNPIAKALSLSSTFSSCSPLSPLFFLSLALLPPLRAPCIIMISLSHDDGVC